MLTGEGLLPIGCTQRNEGIAASGPSAHMLLRNAKADLRNSWKMTAGIVGRFCDHRITKSDGPAREIIRFLVMCHPCPTIQAVRFLEFLRFVSAFRNSICVLGQLAALPSFRAPPPPDPKAHFCFRPHFPENAFLQ